LADLKLEREKMRSLDQVKGQMRANPTVKIKLKMKEQILAQKMALCLRYWKMDQGLGS